MNERGISYNNDETMFDDIPQNFFEAKFSKTPNTQSTQSIQTPRTSQHQKHKGHYLVRRVIQKLHN